MKTLKLLSLLMLALIITNCDSEDDTPEPIPTIDLKADEIVIMVTPTSAFNGDITLIGHVENIGDDFSSGDGQQAAVLYEKQLGTPTDQSGTEVARVPFTVLNANETLQVSYSRSWNTSNEFPPEYILRIEFDPDIQIDGNVNNNDNNSENNSTLITGYDIHDAF